MVYSDAKIFNCIFFLKDLVVQDVIMGECNHDFLWGTYLMKGLRKVHNYNICLLIVAEVLV